MKKIGIIIFIIFLALLVFSKKLEGYIFKKENIGRVLVVDNSNTIVQGISKVGSQALTVEILTGKNKGKILKINNLLNGSMEYDEFYQRNDKVLMYVMEKDGELFGKVLSLLRVDKIIGLGLLFVTLLLVYARKVGFYRKCSNNLGIFNTSFKKWRKYFSGDNFNSNFFISFNYLFSGRFYKKRVYSIFRDNVWVVCNSKPNIYIWGYI